ncbi:SDR family NAD(P)-dependent oxidoreductase [Nocardia sp. NPDC060220]|uniref:SDR family NAD(P)-dependent oxidoreductase n=1 Tax=Nocardia sp. NPDC060220 TaxID=3347076 RepID=UPI003669BAF5
MTIDFRDQVAIVTGGGRGLGRSHALELAARGAHVVVNDLPVPGAAVSPAEQVVAEITAADGSAVADHADITDYAQVVAMVDRTLRRWGRVDVLINNAGILRDASFRNADLSDFRRVIDVHLIGAVHTTKAVWDTMIDQEYGRILMTTSGSGIYGNFGQANYAAAKSALVGLMNVLAIEGRPKGIRVNAIAPLATTQMTASLFDTDTIELMRPEASTAGALFLVSRAAPTKTVLAAGAGVYATAEMQETTGVLLRTDEQTVEGVAAHWEQITAGPSIAVGDLQGQLRRFVERANSTDT